MNTDDLSKKWNHLGQTDPLWAILTDPSKKGNLWNLEEFFQTGRRDVDFFVSLAKQFQPTLKAERALDFGCGVGRLTQALGAHFNEVDGVDIAESMVERARSLNKNPSVRYYLNVESNLKLFPDDTFDFVLTHIVLQHTPPEIHQRYVVEFCRILRPGGVAIFQLPNAFPESWGSSSFDPDQADRIEMYGTDSEVVVQMLKDAGAKVLHLDEDGACGPDFPSFRYVVTK